MRSAFFPLIVLSVAVAGYAPAMAAPSRPAADAGSPAARAVAAAIRDQAGGQVRDFYAARGFWPLWAANGRIDTVAADALVGFLASSDLDGLKPRSYDFDDLRYDLSTARSGDPRAVARAELSLSQSFARYVIDQRRPVDVHMTYLDESLKPRKLKAAAVLNAAALPRSFRDYVTTMGWMSPHYLRMRSLLNRARDLRSPAEDIDRIRLNLDRARILPGAWTHHIVVDAATARLTYYQAGKQVGVMRVVVGTAKTPTPMLAGMVRYAILNPYWNVPVDLAQTNVAPKVLAGRSLAAMRFEALSDWGPDARKLNASTIDWRAVASGAQELRLRQLPGAGNSMGRVKFMFPNESGIYLHDTSDRNLLTKPDRHFSNGCVRLEDAAGLGRWLLGRSIASAAKTPEQDVALPVPVPVYLTYFTATPTAKGIGFVKDVYGRDG